MYSDRSDTRRCQVSQFGHPRIEAWSAAPRGFSQPPTSFIGSRRQGIHRWLFVAWKSKDARARYGVLKVRDRGTAKNKRPAVATFKTEQKVHWFSPAGSFTTHGSRVLLPAKAVRGSGFQLVSTSTGCSPERAIHCECSEWSGMSSLERR